MPCSHWSKENRGPGAQLACLFSSTEGNALNKDMTVKTHILSGYRGDLLPQESLFLESLTLCTCS